MSSAAEIKSVLREYDNRRSTDLEESFDGIVKMFLETIREQGEEIKAKEAEIAALKSLPVKQEVV